MTQKIGTSGISRIVYVARDIERATGMAPSESYVIVSNMTPYAEAIKKQHPDFVYLVEDEATENAAQGDTIALLRSETARSLLSEKGSALLVFKNNAQIEALATENGWTLLNPSSALAEKVENKISQVAWLGELAEKYLPSHIVAPAKNLKWNKEPLVIQWAHGHTGDGTTLVNSGPELRDLQSRFPDRPARASAYAQGPSFTANVVVTPVSILVGNISYQITGLPPFTDSPFATVGNDWSLTHSLLNDAELEQIETMAGEIGSKLRTDGWLGLFGIDIIRDDERNKICLIEVNARQPASTAFESFLQEANRNLGVDGMTIFEAHLKALTGDAIDKPLIPINDGAQIVQRVTKATESVPDDVIGSLALAGYMSISYPNTEHNADLLRIQSLIGIMETHGNFNKRGKEIISNF